LNRPMLNPPSWVFGPVWTALFMLMGIAAFLVWRRQNANKKAVRTALKIFLWQLGLNVCWSYLFFGLRSPGWALLEIIVLLSTIVWCAWLFYKVSKPAGYLLLPYILWVSFATYLNAVYWMLN